MRIQHNIMAMNSYRNYSNNVNSLSSNLEKLSSGYRINRAGDDAAGLAISEKMRAQITGLDAAQKNVQDGISLVKTAEGALQEVQDMMNRMVYLATQSANGTYEDEVDRENLQAEVDSLMSEINRIADSANFNGMKLLDGSLASSAPAASGDLVTLEVSENLTATKVDAVEGKYTAAISGVAASLVDAGDKATITINTSAGDITVDLEVTTAAATGNKAKLSMKINGEEVTGGIESASNGTAIADTDISAAIATNLTNENFEVADSSGILTFTATEAGTDGATVTGASFSATAADGTVTAGTFATATATPAEDVQQTIAETALEEYDQTDDESKADTTYTINGKQFVITTDASSVGDLGDDVAVIIGDPTTDFNSIATQLSDLTGLDVKHDDTGNTYVFSTAADAPATTGGGLTLQIGDTSDSFNQLTVNVADMHAKALGIDGVDIGSLEGAQAAIDTIKTAINSVSAQRGDLGAIQNRLEHTMNNLSVMEENIQNAESAIRDTDVADEMMAYTKNNILIQSAQAMLAQANAVPQGVLQLLQ